MIYVGKSGDVLADVVEKCLFHIIQLVYLPKNKKSKLCNPNVIY